MALWSAGRTRLNPVDGQRVGSVTGAHRPVAAVMADLAGRNRAAIEHLAAGRLDAATTELESLLVDCRWRLGAEHPETLVVEGNLAVVCIMIGRPEDGERLLLANLARRERVFGDEHPVTLTARDALATAHRLAGRCSEALRLYSRVAPQRDRWLGRSHPHTLASRLGLGLACAEAGDAVVALDVLTAALEDSEQAGVGEHAAVLRACLADLRSADDATAAETGSTSTPAAFTPEAEPFVPRQRLGPVLAIDGAAVVRLE